MSFAQAAVRAPWRTAFSPTTPLKKSMTALRLSSAPALFKRAAVRSLHSMCQRSNAALLFLKKSFSAMALLSLASAFFWLASSAAVKRASPLASTSGYLASICVKPAKSPISRAAFAPITDSRKKKLLKRRSAGFSVRTCTPGITFITGVVPAGVAVNVEPIPPTAIPVVEGVVESGVYQGWINSTARPGVISFWTEPACLAPAR